MKPKISLIVCSLLSVGLVNCGSKKAYDNGSVEKSYFDNSTLMGQEQYVPAAVKKVGNALQNNVKEEANSSTSRRVIESNEERTTSRSENREQLQGEPSEAKERAVAEYEKKSEACYAQAIGKFPEYYSILKSCSEDTEKYHKNMVLEKFGKSHTIDGIEKLATSGSRKDRERAHKYIEDLQKISSKIEDYQKKCESKKGLKEGAAKDIEKLLESCLPKSPR